MKVAKLRLILDKGAELRGPASRDEAARALDRLSKALSEHEQLTIAQLARCLEKAAKRVPGAKGKVLTE